MAHSFDPNRLAPVRLAAMDVDGVLTTGAITWTGPSGSGAALVESKSFDVKDGLGLSLVQGAGIEVAWITGRSSAVTAQRADELAVRHLIQGARDKRRALEELASRLGLAREEILYVGDDLNDLPAFEVAGVRVAVADAAPELIVAADWVTQAPGGRGAVREVVEAVLRAQGRWEEALERFQERLRREGIRQ